VPYPIACTGIRPGERLHEVLLSANESFASQPLATGVRVVRTARGASAVWRIVSIVDELAKLVDAGDRQGLAHACLEAAESLQ
jgi:FlaA1/EpsC-like NDP-sugar epimerase